VSGGAGNDTIGVNSTVSFDAGHGRDTTYADLNTVVTLGPSLSSDMTHVTVAGHTATVTFDGSDDRLTIELGPRGPATLAFADGTRIDIQAESKRPARTSG
jgi:hypothetical protein